MDRYKRKKFLGKGKFGSVCKYFDKETRQYVAIKEMDLRNPEGLSGRMIREFSILKETDHPNIIRLLNVVRGEFSLYLVFELLGPSLQSFIQDENKNKKLTIDVAKKFMVQILKGLEYLHAHQIMHRDLTPANILLDAKEENIKIADFGCAREFDLPITANSNTGPSCTYTPPEILLQAGLCTHATDMWDAGVIFAELSTKKVLFSCTKGATQNLQIFDILGTPSDDEWSQISPSSPMDRTYSPCKSKLIQVLKKQDCMLDNDGYDLLQKMLKFVPKERITASEALKALCLTDHV